MKALLLKDFYTLRREAGVLVILVLLLSLFPGTFNAAFAVVYASILPTTAMAYDERSHWDQLVRMLPYSDREVVLSKYVLGWLTLLAVTVVSLAFQASVGFLLSNDTPFFMTTVSAACVAAWCLAITLPLKFRFGVERGRMVTYLALVLACAAAGALIGLTYHVGEAFALVFLRVAPPVVAVLLTAVSVPLSLRFYRERR